MEYTANLVDIVAKEIYSATITITDGKIISIEKVDTICDTYILPPFIDAHIHIESSMLVPAEFAITALKHGTLAVVADPHEIANVLGKAGVIYFIDNAKDVPFKFYFGVPSCVPATKFETAGGTITSDDVEYLFANYDMYFLSEMMNYPGVINKDAEIMRKIEIAKKYNKPIDGHCPMLTGDDLKTYINSGITTDHECTTLAEAKEKITNGMKILIRKGSAFNDMKILHSLIDEYPDMVMLCTDDYKPNALLNGHINLLVKEALKKKHNLFNVLRAASLNPKEHYKLDVGMLQVGDNADFIEVDNLTNFNIINVFCNGKQVVQDGTTLLKYKEPNKINNFRATKILPQQIKVKYAGDSILAPVRIIKITDKSSITTQRIATLKVKNNEIQTDIEHDILKLVVLNRYMPKQSPEIAFVKGFGIKNIAIAISIAHDSHNIIAVGDDDILISRAINNIIRIKGGIAVAKKDSIYELKLQIAGIISKKPIEEVAYKYEVLEEIIKTHGSLLKAPIMTLSFLALPVIPEIRLTDRGLIDVNKQRFYQKKDIFLNKSMADLI